MPKNNETKRDDVFQDPSVGCSLDVQDVRKLVALLAAVAAEPGSHVAKKRKLLDGLCKMIAATKWLWAQRTAQKSTAPPRFVGWLHSGFSPEELTAISASAAHPSIRKMDAQYANELKRRQTHMTLRLQDYDTTQQWPGSGAAKLAEQAGVGDFIASTCPIDINKASVVALYRPPKDMPFSERERLITHIVLSEVGWLHTLGWPEQEHVDVIAALPRSHLVLLNLLVQGHTRQEASDLMYLSIHTINSYTKTIFKHFRVNTQTELMRHFLFGDGNDAPIADHER